MNILPGKLSFLRVPRKYLPVYGIVVIYFIYAAYKYATVENNGDYSSAFYFIHSVFHEIGHAVCSKFPTVVHVFGGSLFQWLTPIACGIYFLYGNEKHALPVAVGWLGFSLLDSAIYIRDAIEQELTLVAPFAGPDTELIHDWNYLLSHWHVLHKAHSIGNAVATTGYIFVGIAIIALVLAMLSSKGDDET